MSLACGSRAYHWFKVKSRCVLQIPEIKLFLKVCMQRSEEILDYRTLC